MYALIDCNNFYVSCERLFNPKLVNQPVAVLSNNDGCIIARSNEAKALGIPMGAPYFKWKEVCENNQVQVLSSNYALYGDLSNRVMCAIGTLCPNMHVYSIDEAFVAVEEKWDERQLIEHFLQVKALIKQWVGIPVSIGIGATKTLAKIANEIAKKSQKTEGVFFLSSDSKGNAILDRIPVYDVWGIGRRSAEHLHKHGIYSAYDFMQSEDILIRKLLSVSGVKIAWELRGIDCVQMEDEDYTKKAICRSRLFNKPTNKITDLEEAVASYIVKATQKLRQQGSLASCIAVFLTKHPLEEGKRRTMQAEIVLPEPTSYAPRLINYAKKCLKSLYRNDWNYRKAGVLLYGLVPENHFQLDLFASEDINREKEERTMSLIENINKKLGKTAIRFAAEGIEQSWRGKQDLSSKRFTTDWKELLIINIDL